MRDNYFRTGEGFLCVYAVTMPDSYEQMSSFVEQILKVTEDEDVMFTSIIYFCIHIFPQIPVLVIGNKVDLVDKRQVTTAQGEKLAASLRCTFMETSTQNLFISHTFFRPFFCLFHHRIASSN
jgi:GTPase SAR1 family protein